MAPQSKGERPQGRFGRPVVGLLVDSIDLAYQDEVIHELAAAARAHDVDLLCFCGGTLGAKEDRTTQRNRVYELASAHNVDALVVTSGSLGSRIGTDQLTTFLERFDPLPRCSLGVALAGTPAITVDNASGMREAVLHLVEMHGKERIAFIAGPQANEEARERHRGYLDALQDRRIEPDPRLVVEGDFLEDSGATAIRTLLDERRVSFDAVVAASDEMAVGAMAELDERGLHVPEAIAVVGFDDTIAGRYAKRPLTTVRQGIAVQAEAIIQTVLHQLSGEEVPEVNRLDTELVVRRSCGCTGTGGAAATNAPLTSAPPEPSSLAGRRMQILIELMASAPELQGTKWADRLLDSFVAEMRDQKTVSFTAVVDELVEQTIAAGQEPVALQPVISALRRVAAPALLSRPDLMFKSESLLHEARVLVANMTRHREMQRRLDAERMVRTATSLARALIGSADMNAVMRAVQRHLPRLGITSCYLSLYEHRRGDRDSVSGEDTVRLILAHDASQAEPIARQSEVFPALELVPRDLLSRDRARAYVVEPLVSHKRALGLMVLELGDASGAVYESLRAQISAAVYNLQLTDDVAAASSFPGTQT